MIADTASFSSWEAARISLDMMDIPIAAVGLVPTIGNYETMVTMHNDAVIQGLSEMPFMQDVRHWTIGTGLGNASYKKRGHESKGDCRENFEQELRGAFTVWTSGDWAF